MEKYPDIKVGQFTVQFLDRNTGIVLDHDFNHHGVDPNKKVYSVHNSLSDAKEYAEQKLTKIMQGDKNVGYYIRDNKESVVFHTDNL